MADKLIFRDIDEPGLNTIDVYRRRGGYERLRKALTMPREAVLNELLASGLRGRGGAGFEMGKKVSFLPKGVADIYLCCNADESEPGTFKDREILQKNPHLLIEGIIISAWAAGANKAFIYIRGEYSFQADIVDAALVEAREAGFLGENILGSEHSLSLVLHRGAGAYECGEETALLDSLEGKRGNPRLKPPFPANQGLYQGPTLINNVETLSTVPFIIELGGSEYAKIGVQNSSGTKLISISGHVRRPGNYEIELGMSTRDIVYGLAGGVRYDREVKLWWPGGSSGAVLTKDELDTPYDYDSLRKAGSSLGSGAMIICDDQTSVVELAYKTAYFYHHESCGKCVPCREGTNWTTMMIKRMMAGEATPMDLDIITSICDNILGNSLCALGDSMAIPIASMVKRFRPEFEEYIEARRQESYLGTVEPAPELPLIQGAVV
jgi:NADH-quinone oxidoreductase subunit F